MKIRVNSTFYALLILAGLLARVAYGANEPRQEVPEAVLLSASDVFPGAQVRYVESHAEDAFLVYEFAADTEDGTGGVLIASDGRVLERWDERGEDEDEGGALSRRDFVFQELRAFKPEALRQAIDVLEGSPDSNGPDFASFRARLRVIEEGLARLAEDGALAEAERLLADVDELRYAVLVQANPLVPDRLFFVKRFTYQSSHYYTDYIDGVSRFGGSLCVLYVKEGRVRDLVPSMKDGFFGRHDVSYDGTRIVFAWKRRFGEGFRIYEVRTDGTGLRQLTFPPPEEAQLIEHYAVSRPGNAPEVMLEDGGDRYFHHTDDMHPCYLPDGGICFISTRCQYSTLCDIPDLFTTTVLYRMDADGSKLRKLSNSALSEAAPSVMNDGRILYTRWEYVDKGTFPAKGLWAIRPDGTGNTEVFGNQVVRPMTLIYGRAVPGSPNKFFAIATGHGPLSVGTVTAIDISAPIRTPQPAAYVMPSYELIQPDRQFHEEDWLMPDGNYRHFIDPYPLSEDLLLVAYNPHGRWNDPTGYGLYLIDTFGNRVRLYEDPEISCWQPMPLAAKPRPPIVAAATEPQSEDTGTLLVSDLYRGLDGVAPGTVKWLRIMEQVPRPWAARRRWPGDSMGGSHAAISAGTHLGLKVMHGVVPVHEDGSAHFTVPAERSIFLQALDEDFMEVQRMRTFINMQPGETRSCIGCHETRQEAPENRYIMALAHPPVEPMAQPGDEEAGRPIHYPTDVQPIFDMHCVSCHGRENPDGDLDLTGEETRLFSRSYQNLIERSEGRSRHLRHGGDLLASRGLPGTEAPFLELIYEEAPEDGGVEPLPPYSLGSHASKLVQVIRDGHYDVALSQPEFVRLVTWVDSNAQYYGSYYGRRNKRYEGHPNYRPTPTLAQAVSREAPLPLAQR